MTRWIVADRIFDGEELLAGHAIGVKDGRVAAVKATKDIGPNASVDRVEHVLTPGFFDLQVNGGGGVLFNQTPTPEGLAAIARAHRMFGTTHCLPTVITDAPEVLDAAAEAMLSFCGRDGVLGMHIEGPHIAVSRHGTHDPRFVRPLDARTLNVVERLRSADVPVLLTLAPEAVQPGQIAELSQMGVVVSIGHSDASFEQVNAALDEGAQMFTHLFNAMSQMENRAPGVVGAAITSEAYCGMIVDGIHVSPAMLKIAVSARPIADRMIIVSDSMPTVGGPDNFRLYGQDVHLADGKLINSNGSLAGAHITMAQSVSNAMRLLGVTLRDALFMGVTAPHRAMKTEPAAGLLGRPVSDLIAFDPDTGAVEAVEEREPHNAAV